MGKKDVKFSAANRNQLLYSNNPTMKLRSVDEPTWCEYMLIKGLLNKFDWTVSAGYEEAELHSDIAEKNYAARFAITFQIHCVSCRFYAGT